MPWRVGPVFIVEDDEVAGATLTRIVEELGSRKVRWTRSLRDARLCLDRAAWDLVLLDLVLPDGVGYELLRPLRDHVPRSRIMAMSRNATREQVATAMRLGADEYFEKPVARDDLNRCLSMSQSLASGPSSSIAALLTWGPICVDLIGSKVWVDEREVGGLQPLQIRLLAHLIQNAGKTCPHQELQSRVLGVKRGGDQLPRIVHYLRDRLGPHGRFIKNVRGVGYALRE